MADKQKDQKAGGGGGAAKGGGKGGQPQGGGGGGKREKGKGGAEGPKRGSHAGANIPAPAPRLRDYYWTTVRQRLTTQFELTNPHQVPNLEKIVINVGV